MSDLNDIAGAILGATVVDALLLGMIIVSTHEYYKGVRGGFVAWYSIAALFCLNTATSMLSIMSCWNYLVTNFNSPVVFAQAGLYTSAGTPLGAICGVIVQFYFAHKIFCLSGQRPLRLVVPTIICVLATLNLIFTCILTWGIFSTGRFYAKFTMVWIVDCVFIIAPSLDALITFSMIFLLKKMKTDNVALITVITRILRSVVSTNLLTTIFSIATLILYRTPSTGLWFSVPGRIIGKLYMITILTSLKLQASRDEGSQATTSATNLKSARPAHSVVQIRIDEMVHEDFSESDQFTKVPPRSARKAPPHELERIELDRLGHAV